MSLLSQDSTHWTTPLQLSARFLADTSSQPSVTPSLFRPQMAPCASLLFTAGEPQPRPCPDNGGGPLRPGDPVILVDGYVADEGAKPGPLEMGWVGFISKYPDTDDPDILMVRQINPALSICKRTTEYC